MSDGRKEIGGRCKGWRDTHTHLVRSLNESVILPVSRPVRLEHSRVCNQASGDPHSIWSCLFPASLQVHVLHLLKKHKGSRRPSSWRQENITCTKEEAMQSLAGECTNKYPCTVIARRPILHTYSPVPCTLAHNTLAPSPSPTALREQIVSAGSASMQRAFEDLAKVRREKMKEGW